MIQLDPNRFGCKFQCFLLALLALAAGLNAQETTTKQRHNELPKTDQTERRIHLEGIEDLDHLSYLSLRNYNLTDELLLQPTWLSNNNQLDPGQRLRDDPASSSIALGDPNNRLASMLESLVLHLKNGHLRRLTLEELEQIVNGQNLTEALETMRTRHEERRGSEQNFSSGTQQGELQVNELSPNGDNINLRCLMLVTLYRSELMDRMRATPSGAANVLHQTKGDELESVHRLGNETTNEKTQQQVGSEQVDESRLVRLCELAVSCNSAEDLVDLISKPWKRTRPGSAMRWAESDHLERESSIRNADRREPAESADNSREVEEAIEPSSLKLRHRKQLHDSVSMSLTKLCPLILFPLHEADGQCLVRRDDRPPTIRVWAFATLFVTIVCFCSLIGLSITPLIGQMSSDSSPPASESLPANDSGGSKFWPSFLCGGKRSKQSAHKSGPPNKHKASLTLFEGLAVGSLVGSALFSLLPQAFELQERESNQSFLLKAFIIFSGIYLFFLSERIMRIILDTRQKRKRKRRLTLTRRSSTTQAAADATPASHYQHHQHQTAGRSGPLQRQHGNMALISTSDSFRHNSNSHTGALQQELSRTTSRTTKTTGSESVNSKQRARKKATISEEAADRDYRSRAARKQPVSHRRAYKQAQRKLSTNKARSNRGHPPDQRRGPQRASRQMRHESGHQDSSSPKLSCFSSSSSCSSTSSSFSSYVLNEAHRSRLAIHRAGLLADSRATDSQATYSDRSNSDSDSQASVCSSCLAERGQTALMPMNNFSDSDHDNNQRRAVTKRMSELTHHLVAGSNARSSSNAKSRERAEIGPHAEQQQVPHPPKATLAFSQLEPGQLLDLNQRETRSSNGHWRKSKQRDISTVAWMIILGDGLHNFIDGISIGAAFSESILSGISISVAVICEEFPHELGDFAVLISSGMTIRQALGYNFLSASTCYLGMAIGIILGDVTDGASYISALAAGVFLYIALVDMMGELSAALESSSRFSIAHTLKLLLLQNVGIAIGISIIFVLSFIDF